MKYIQLYEKKYKACLECNGHGEYNIGAQNVPCWKCNGTGEGFEKDKMISLEGLRELIK